MIDSIVSKFKWSLNLSPYTLKLCNKIETQKMSQYPYTGPYSTTNQPISTGTGTGLGTGLGTGVGTGLGGGYGVSGTTGTYGTSSLGTGLQTGYTSTDPHYIPSSTLGTQNIQQ